MPVHWSVVPAQPEELGFREWLTENGLEVPQFAGRFPTLDELTTVLDSFEGFPIQKEGYCEPSQSLSLGEPSSQQYAHILGSLREDHIQFHFFGSDNQSITMLEILKRLARICGPFVLYESYAATPVIVEEATNLTSALEDWVRRTLQKYSKDLEE